MNLHAARSSAAATPTPVFTADEGRKAEAGGAAFADLLDERRAARAADGARPGQRGAFDAAPPPPTPARAAEPPRASPAARERPREAEPDHPRDAAGPARAAEARPASRPAERGERKAGAARDSEPSAERRTPAADETHAEAAPVEGAAAPDDDPLDSLHAQTVLDWLSRLDAATPGLVPATAGAAAKTDGTAEDATVLSAALGRVANDPAATGRAGPAAAAVPPAAGTDAATDGALTAALLQGMEEGPAPGASAEPAPLPALPSLVPMAPPPGVLAAGAAAPAAASPAGLTLQLATPVTAPDFSQALATQLTTLAREGVQEATLQLNPAELGPIAVKIVLDGVQAQVDFAAEHARTREALEAGLPTLAAALHGAGLTLSGGGVFERRRGHDGAPAEAPRGGEASADAVDDAVAAVTPRRALVRGLLDAYA